MLSISTSKMATSVDDNQIGLMSSASGGCRNKPFTIKRKSSCPNLESWKFERQVNINKLSSTQEVNISEVSVEVDSTFINETCCLSSIWKPHSTNNEERRSSAEVSIVFLLLSVLPTLTSKWSKYCDKTYNHWANTLKMCSPASVILTSIVTMIVSFDAI